jgi:hypothetical protein
MFKFVSLILISLLCLSIQKQYSQDGREFLTGLMSQLQGKDFKLDDKCLGQDFENDMEKLIDAIKNENTILTAVVAGKIISEMEEKCPKNDLNKVYNDSLALVEKNEIMNRIMAHSQEVVHIMKEELVGNQMTAKNIGETLGKLINTVIYEKKQIMESNPQLTFLGYEDSFETFKEESVDLFVSGFFEGVSSVPIEKNQCVNDIGAAKGDLVAAFSALINAVKTRKDIFEALMKFYQLTLHLKGLDANCRFTDLSSDLVALSTKAGIAKLAFRITTHLLPVIEDLKTALISVEIKEFRKGGFSFGALTKIALNYSTI